MRDDFRFSIFDFRLSIRRGLGCRVPGAYSEGDPSAGAGLETRDAQSGRRGAQPETRNPHPRAQNSEPGAPCPGLFSIENRKSKIKNLLVCLVAAACLLAISRGQAAGVSEKSCRVVDQPGRLLESGAGSQTPPNAEGGANGAGGTSGTKGTGGRNGTNGASGPGAANGSTGTGGASGTNGRRGPDSAGGAAAGKVAPGPAASSNATATASNEIKIVSYNMRWRGGDDLKRLIAVLRDDAEIGGADVIGLQEVDRGRRRSGNVNAARLMAESLGMHYAWAAPPSDGEKRDDREAGEDETGVAILSRFPLSDVERIVLPHSGPGCRRRAAVGATIEVGGRRIRVYSLHAETRLAIARKTEQWRAVVDSPGARGAEHAVVLGDFNTIKGKDVRAARELFDAAGFHTPFPDDKSTWKTLFIKLKLDWLWLRGLQPTAHGISKHVKFSDHYPLWVKVKL
jgi:endonuclease/exonuclease/phosphatase family metal-dependent hydrolase